MTNGPSFEGSPERTAMSAPFGKLGGAGPHLRSPEFIGIFISSAMAVVAHARTKAKAVNLRGMIASVFGRSVSCASGEPSQLLFDFQVVTAKCSRRNTTRSPAQAAGAVASTDGPQRSP